MMRRNIWLATDSYKPSHYGMLPPEVESLSYLLEPRKGANIVFLGLQGVCNEYLNTPFTKEDVEEAEMIWADHGEPFDKETAMYILNKYGGYMPVRIDALPEGSIIDAGVPPVRVTTLDERAKWVGGLLETILVRGTWYPSNVATNALYERNLLLDYYKYTSDASTSEIYFKMHDFGGRGVSSGESAAIGGMARLAVFRGTDTIEAVRYARAYYGEHMAGFSIPAGEHSVIISWGKDREFESIENAIDKYLVNGRPGAMLAMPIDSYDAYSFMDTLLSDPIRKKIENTSGVFVARPDSGIPEEIVPQLMEMVKARGLTTTNSKGYEVFPNYLRMIQGDGINSRSLGTILGAVMNAGFSTENLAFGQGSGALQEVKRDDNSWAMKPTAVFKNGEWVGVKKDPITAPNKASKEGLYTVQLEDGVYVPKKFNEESYQTDQLEVVWECGEHKRITNLTEIRNRIDSVFPL